MAPHIGGRGCAVISASSDRPLKNNLNPGACGLSSAPSSACVACSAYFIIFSSYVIYTTGDACCAIILTSLKYPLRACLSTNSCTLTPCYHPDKMSRSAVGRSRRTCVAPKRVDPREPATKYLTGEGGGACWGIGIGTSSNKTSGKRSTTRSCARSPCMAPADSCFQGFLLQKQGSRVCYTACPFKHDTLGPRTDQLVMNLRTDFLHCCMLCLSNATIRNAVIIQRLCLFSSEKFHNHNECYLL